MLICIVIIMENIMSLSLSFHRHITPMGVEIIKRFEGFSAVPYLCPAGYLTIGYGHVIRGAESRSYGSAALSEGQADSLLRQDIEEAEQAVMRLIAVALTDGQFDALVSFTFNLGAGALQRSTLRRKINREEYESAAEEFYRWIWAGGKKLPGLMARRAAEARRYREC